MDFKATLDYIETQLKFKTNFQIFRQQFFVSVRVRIDPVLTSTIQSVDKNYTYDADFREVSLSAKVNFLNPIRLTIIPNLGCDESYWQNPTPHSAMNSVALVMHNKNNCSVAAKSTIKVNIHFNKN
ncbi:unnamed protein product [Rotaria magnacalcarata]|uniref:Uncharacterized protein n=1 Tax=Rotaria magnacalcarata TaxID=392030 RepID=A0A816NTM0_9BILA|nr:unnamed protein product [Rotaria magnacalcarata]CAF4224984.1 unnamed protein product [Rotaria magnacalcarata]